MRSRAEVVLQVVAVLGVFAALATAQEATRHRRVVVLGFDGMDPALVERWRDDLPNLAGLIESSGGGALATTTPAESPVSWASMITGLDPGETDVYDFIRHARRDADGNAPEDFSVRPRYALFDLEMQPATTRSQRLALAGGAALAALALVLLLARSMRRPWKHAWLMAMVAFLIGGGGGLLAGSRWLDFSSPAPQARRQGTPFWEFAGAEGLRVRALTVPMTFPAECGCDCDARILAGLGVPDVRGTNGTYQVWTSHVTDAQEREFGGIVMPAALAGKGITVLQLSGPLDFTTPEAERQRAVVDFEVWRAGERELGVSLPGEADLVLGVSEWSRPVEITFALNPLVSIRGLARLHLAELAATGNDFTLYLSPISFHPASPPPPLRLSEPRSYSGELCAAIGPFKTLGWAADTWGLADGVLDDEAFLTDVRESFEQRRALLRYELERADEWEVLMAVFEDIDRASHMMFRHLDDTHPAHDPATAAHGIVELRRVYRLSDEVVGEVLSRFKGDPDTLVLVVSDHGFASFRREVSLNTWLEREGYMATGGATVAARRLGVGALFGEERFFENVDWGRTRAFAMGLGTIYCNQRGLDPEGAVSPSEVEALTAEIAARLLELEDPEHPGERVVKSVGCKRGDGEGGHELALMRPGDVAPEVDATARWGRDAPELVVGFAPGYRVSWQTSLGGRADEVFEDNLGAWSGDHCSVDPDSVPGVVAANVPLVEAGARGVRDVAPTALSWLGVPVPAAMRGKNMVAGQER